MSECLVPEENFGGSRILFRETAHQFKVDLTPQEDVDWKTLLGAAYLVDHLVDIEKKDIVMPFGNILNGEFRTDLTMPAQVRLHTYAQRSEESSQNLLAEAVRVDSLAKAQRSATTANEVVAIRLDEADILARLLSLPAFQRPDAAARNKFNSWLQSWSRTGYLLDSLVDMEPDYETGESGLKPTLGARATIATSCFTEAVVAAKKTPSRTLGKCAINAFRYLALNKKPVIKLQELQEIT